jgi:hypothetical protein
MIEIGYVGNLGRHQVIPVPFNQAKIVTSTSDPLGYHAGSTAKQYFSYGYTPLDPSTFNSICVNQPSDDTVCAAYGHYLNNYEGGNVDLRVPYLGYSSESESYTAAGISAYHALQVHVEKRLSHGLQAGASYTWSHTTDEQSGMGLFYNGSNPDAPPFLRSGYGTADFDRKHVLTFTWSYTVPKFFAETSLKGRLADGWSFQGLGVIQSGQPYSIVDYTGAVGGLYYSVFNGITNPIVPLAPGCTPKNARTADSGAFYDPVTGNGAALKASCFTVPLITPGVKGVPLYDTYETDFTTGQRNIFRQTVQKRADASLVKVMKMTKSSTLRYTFDVYNLTNTTSLDIPTDNVAQNAFYNNEPIEGSTLYTPPTGLGIGRHTIGSARQIQMSLSWLF